MHQMCEARRNSSGHSVRIFRLCFFMHFQVMLLARIKTYYISDKYFVVLKVAPFWCKFLSGKWKCSLVFHSRNELL